MTTKSQIEVENKLITIVKQDEQDYISLTDMVRGEEGSDHIRNWMRNRNTVEFIGLWETLNNPNFKPVEFDTFRKQAGLNSFNLTPIIKFIRMRLKTVLYQRKTMIMIKNG